MPMKKEQVGIHFRVPKHVRESLEAYARENGVTISYVLRKLVETEIMAPEMRLRSDVLADISFALALLLKETLKPNKQDQYARFIKRLLNNAARLKNQLPQLFDEFER